jgi:hypothetical protein
MAEMVDLQAYRQTIDTVADRRRQALASVKREEFAIQDVEVRLESVGKAQEIVQRIAQGIQQQVHERISRVVSLCLSAVFDDPYEFSIRFDRKRGKTEAKMVFSRDGMELDDEPLREIGGGVVDITALALRASCILMSRPAPRRFLSLDEPFSNVRGERNKARTRKMVERLVDDLGFQVVLNTDLKYFQLGTVVELE